MINNRLKSYGVVGFSAAIVSDKGILWSNGYGYAIWKYNRELKRGGSYRYLDESSSDNEGVAKQIGITKRSLGTRDDEGPGAGS